MNATRRTFVTAAAAGSAGTLSVSPLAAIPLPQSQSAPLDSERFRRAVIAGNIATVTQLLDRDPALAWARDEHGVSVYALACLNRQKAVAELLASRGLVLDIFEAAAGGQLSRLQELLKANPSGVDLRSSNGRTALHFAAATGQSDLIAAFTSAGADLSAGPESPVLLAVDNAEPAAAQSFAQSFLGNGANPNASRKDGATILHLAAAKGYGEIARMLVHRGADPAARDSRGRTPLDVATGDAVAVMRGADKIDRAFYGRRFMRDLKGAAVVRDDTSGLPLPLITQFVSVAHSNADRVKQLLKLAPALLNTRAPWDETAIEAAAHMGLTELADYLADAGSPISTCTAALLGQTAIVRSNLAEEPRCLYERGAHDLPLLAYTAFDQLRVDIAELLIAKGTDVNVRIFGQTVLHMCASKGHLELARLLVDHGADVNAPWRAKDGSATPLAVAVRAKREAVAEFLRSRGGV